MEAGSRKITAGAAANVVLKEDVVARTMKLVDSLPAAGTTSMHRDILAGRPSEFDAWNGAVVLLGRGAGVATPPHDFLYGCLLPQERAGRGEILLP